MIYRVKNSKNILQYIFALLCADHPLLKTIVNVEVGQGLHRSLYRYQKQQMGSTLKLGNFEVVWKLHNRNAR